MLVLLCIPMMLAVGADRGDLSLQGGWTWQSMVYSLWEALLCVGECIGLVHLFPLYLNQRGRVAGFLVPKAYSAYIIRAPVIVFLAGGSGRGSVVAS